MSKRKNKENENKKILTKFSPIDTHIYSIYICIYMYYVNIYTYIPDLVLFRIDHNTHVCTYSTYIVVITKIR